MAKKRADGSNPLVLRGNALSRIDDHGRLKLPASFRRIIADGYGTALYVTSLQGDSMWVYPLPIWEQREARLMKLTNQHPAVTRFVARVSYFGSETELDSQGRFVVPPLLRTSARIEGEVAVFGSLDHLEVWNNALFASRLEGEPWTADDQRAIAELGDLMADSVIGHEPVLLGPTIDALAIRANALYVDATLGLGGHAEAILARGGQVLGLDRDPESIERARARLRSYEETGQFRPHHADYRRLVAVLAEQRTGPVDGVLADLGVSTHQLLTAERGFSLRTDGPLDMRMDRSTGQTAADLVNHAPPGELEQILFRFGEEPQARRIVRAIVARRIETPFATTADLSATVAAAKFRPRGPERIHPATLTFQALRIAVNDELSGIDRFVTDAVSVLRKGGRLAVISFHSLEDRQVKGALRTLAQGCLCPPKLVVCRCGHTAQVTLLARRSIRPDDDECARNPRARSARLRTAVKTSDDLAPELGQAA